MERFLTNKDYSRRILTYDLQQLIMDSDDPNNSYPRSLDYSVLYDVELQAQAQITSYLIKRYDIKQVFRPTTVFDINKIYTANNLVQVYAPAFISGNTYNVGDRISYSAGTNQDFLFYCIQSGYTGNTPNLDTTYFSGGTIPNGQMFYTSQPADSYLINNTYPIGSVVFYNDYTYTAKTYSDNSVLREFNGTDVANDNGSGVIPSLTKDWDKYWIQSASKYTVQGIYPDQDTTGTWIMGDNRNQLIVQFMLDITLYHLGARVNPRNSVELWAIRYDGNTPLQTGGSIGLLKKINAGQMNLECPELLPIQGQSLYWTSDARRNLDY